MSGQELRPKDWFWLDMSFYAQTTMAWSAEQHGANLLMMLTECRDGPAPDEEDVLAATCRVSVSRWRDVLCGALRPYFIVDECGWRSQILARCRENGLRHRPASIVPPKRAFPSGWSATRRIVFSRDGFACTYCGAADVPLQCDHVVPVARGGSDEIDNLTTACAACNASKSAMDVSEWLSRRIGRPA